MNQFNSLYHPFTTSSGFVCNNILCITPTTRVCLEPARQGVRIREENLFQPHSTNLHNYTFSSLPSKGQTLEIFLFQFKKGHVLYLISIERRGDD